MCLTMMQNATIWEEAYLIRLEHPNIMAGRSTSGVKYLCGGHPVLGQTSEMILFLFLIKEVEIDSQIFLLLWALMI